MTVFLVSFCNILFNFAIGLLVAKFLGPEEYGRFALAYATAIFVQTGFFDWIRLGATRFYSERIRYEEPALRATLDFGFAIITAGLAVGICLLLFTGIKFTLSYGLIALALSVAVANGLFDYHTRWFAPALMTVFLPGWLSSRMAWLSLSWAAEPFCSGQPK